LCLAGVARSRIATGKLLMFGGASGGRDERAEPSTKWRETELLRARVSLYWAGDNKRRRGR